MAYDGVWAMTDEELIAWEEKIRHAFHLVERREKRAADGRRDFKLELEAFADALAASRGIAATQRSGGDKPPEEP